MGISCNLSRRLGGRVCQMLRLSVCEKYIKSSDEWGG